MKLICKRRGFTIIELLTVMSIIVILISLLVPSLNAVRRYSRVVRQKGQFHNIGTGLEMFSIDFDGYPDSSENASKGIAPPEGAPYCGAMKLCEAMLGRDGLGFHPRSRFVADGLDENGVDLYPEPPPGGLSDPTYAANIRERKHTYIDADKYQKVSLEDLCGVDPGRITPFTEPNAVICDVFQRVHGEISRKKIGMPVLYYKADTSKLEHDPNTVVIPPGTACTNIYDYRDNYLLLGLHEVGMAILDHPMYTDLKLFYKNTWNRKSIIPRPYNEGTYILMSAGWDGLYGTKDDVYNFSE